MPDADPAPPTPGEPASGSPHPADAGPAAATRTVRDLAAGDAFWLVLITPWDAAAREVETGPPGAVRLVRYVVAQATEHRRYLRPVPPADAIGLIDGRPAARFRHYLPVAQAAGQWLFDQWAAQATPRAAVAAFVRGQAAKAAAARHTAGNCDARAEAARALLAAAVENRGAE